MFRRSSRFTFTMSEISFHCSGRGSTPVGLWAQACSRITLCSGMAWHKKNKTKKKITLCNTQSVQLSLNQYWTGSELTKTHRIPKFFSNVPIVTRVPQSYRDVVQGSLEVKTTGGGIVVSVGFELHACIAEDRRVVSPGWLGQVHVARTAMETGLREKQRLSENPKHDMNFAPTEYQNLPKSWLQCAEIPFQRWSGQWCSVGRRDQLMGSDCGRLN